jgi:hypothetical protein
MMRRVNTYAGTPSLPNRRVYLLKTANNSPLNTERRIWYALRIDPITRNPEVDLRDAWVQAYGDEGKHALLHYGEAFHIAPCEVSGLIGVTPRVGRRPLQLVGSNVGLMTGQ